MATNRNAVEGAKTWEGFFGNDFGQAADLRFATIERDGAGVISGEVLPDDPLMGSMAAFREVRDRMKAEGRPGAVFVHGFNNSWEDAVRAGLDLAEIYGMEVLVFTWPSDGVLNYREVKRRAILSVPAFDRLLEKLVFGLKGTTPETACGQRLSLIAHSMGNWILENFIRSDFFNNEFLIFDNVNMVAADVNNEGHVAWVDKIQARRDVNIFINEDDIALDISTAKIGEKQKARLGNFPRRLESKRAHYYNLTDALDRLGELAEHSHGYFKDRKIILEKLGDTLYQFSKIGVALSDGFTGQRIGGGHYHPGLNFYSL